MSSGAGWGRGAWRAAAASLLRRLLAPRMLYGVRHPDGRWLAHSRIGSSTHVEGWPKLDLGDHVFIGHFNLIDASCGLRIGQGTQITSHVCVLTHSSHVSLRLHGEQYFGHADPVGYERGAITIGPCCFIGPHSVLAPGTRLGKGVLVRAHSYVRGEVPDFAIVQGQPAQVVGDTRHTDATWLAQHPELAEHYQRWAGELPANKP